MERTSSNQRVRLASLVEIINMQLTWTGVLFFNRSFQSERKLRCAFVDQFLGLFWVVITRGWCVVVFAIFRPGMKGG